MFPERDRGTGVLDDEFNRSKVRVIEGNSALIYVNAAAASRCDKCFHKDAVCDELMLSHVERDLHSLAHIPESERNFCDPRPLQKDDFSSVIGMIRNINDEWKEPAI
jgi:hypothetical protein